MKKLFVIVFAVSILSACNSQIEPTNNNEPEAVTYTLDDVAKHSTPNDCWIILHGKVYDVSEFGTSGHPGGEAVYQGCGIDATELFETRPTGSGTPHSEQARTYTDNFYIGDLSGS